MVAGLLPACAFLVCALVFWHATFWLVDCMMIFLSMGKTTGAKPGGHIRLWPEHPYEDAFVVEFSEKAERAAQGISMQTLSPIRQKGAACQKAGSLRYASGKARVRSRPHNGRDVCWHPPGRSPCPLYSRTIPLFGCAARPGLLQQWLPHVLWRTGPATGAKPRMRP